MIAALRANLKILWNHIMKYFRVKHDQCDSIICYWSLCPREHWDPGCVSNWFVYLATISLQLEQSVINIYTKIYNVDKNYKDLVSHIFYWQYVVGGVFLMIQKCKLEPTAWDAVPHKYHIWGMVTKYCQYEFFNFAGKLHIQYIPFKLLSVTDATEYIQKTLWMMRNQTIRHRKINKMHGVKNWVSQKLTT